MMMQLNITTPVYGRRGGGVKGLVKEGGGGEGGGHREGGHCNSGLGGGGGGRLYVAMCITRYLYLVRAVGAACGVYDCCCLPHTYPY